MSLYLASAYLPTPTNGAGLPTLGRNAMRLLSLAGRLRPMGVVRAMIRSERLSAAMLRDVGLRADHIGQAPIWGHGGIIWRP